jgi:hypothetical protein
MKPDLSGEVPVISEGSWNNTFYLFQPKADQPPADTFFLCLLSYVSSIKPDFSEFNKINLHNYIPVTGK